MKRTSLALTVLQPFAEHHNEDPDFVVGLVHPYLVEAWQKNRLKYRESLALGYLSGALNKHGYTSTSINAELLSLGPEEVAERLLGDPRIRLIGISAKSQRTYRAARQIARLVKAVRQDVHITLGGVFPSAADKEILADCAEIDSIVRGEGEYAIVELAARLQRGLPLKEMRGLSLRVASEYFRTPDRPRIRDLDGLAFPDRNDLQEMVAQNSRGSNSAYLVASRGCYASCTFCSIHQIYGDHNVVRRSVESIADEMQSIKDRFGVSRFSFVDDLFIMPSPNGIRWIHDFCDLLAERKLEVNFYAEMRADTIEKSLVRRLMNVGLHRLFIGAESGVDSVLVRWEKGTTVEDNDKALRELREIGMAPHQINFGYIMFDPEMTFAELKEQYRWIRDSGYAKVQHLQNKMNVYWGTPQYRRMIEQGRVDDSALGNRWIYTFDDPKVNSFEPAFRRFHRRYEADPRVLSVLAAREAFMERVQEDKNRTPMPHWLFECLSQAMRRIDQTDRDCYFYVFERLFDFLNGDEILTESAEEEVWNGLQPLLDTLAFDAELLSVLAANVQQITEDDEGEMVAKVGRAWRAENDDAATVTVWLAERAQSIDGFRVSLGFRGDDRYDHACETVRFSLGDDPAEVITLQNPRANELLGRAGIEPVAAAGGTLNAGH
ncbi:radical SAM protein [Streptomyces sp. GbtcB6]|uniref:B12-binding domain-containing radical SAM protein n=1 Tax=Streptomyces sp. GbtcB6 TaxID=2824751 RepID=UPI001C2F383A|nr:radical SAM protein [Streptomyces sp. GbtcB6]